MGGTYRHQACWFPSLYLWGRREEGTVGTRPFQGIGWDKPTDYALDEVKETAVAGHRFSTGWAKGQKNFFVAEFSQPVQVQPLDSGRWLVQVADATRPLMIKVGLSAVSIANARQNLQTEIPDWNFIR